MPPYESWSGILDRRKESFARLRLAVRPGLVAAFLAAAAVLRLRPVCCLWSCLRSRIQDKKPKNAASVDAGFRQPREHNGEGGTRNGIIVMKKTYERLSGRCGRQPHALHPLSWLQAQHSQQNTLLPNPSRLGLLPLPSFGRCPGRPNRHGLGRNTKNRALRPAGRSFPFLLRLRG